MKSATENRTITIHTKHFCLWCLNDRPLLILPPIWRQFGVKSESIRRQIGAKSTSIRRQIGVNSASNRTQIGIKSEFDSNRFSFIKSFLSNTLSVVFDPFSLNPSCFMSFWQWKFSFSSCKSRLSSAEFMSCLHKRCSSLKNAGNGVLECKIKQLRTRPKPVLSGLYTNTKTRHWPCRCAKVLWSMGFWFCDGLLAL